MQVPIPFPNTANGQMAAVRFMAENGEGVGEGVDVGDGALSAASSASRAAILSESVVVAIASTGESKGLVVAVGVGVGDSDSAGCGDIVGFGLGGGVSVSDGVLVGVSVADGVPLRVSGDGVGDGVLVIEAGVAVGVPSGDLVGVNVWFFIRRCPFPPRVRSISGVPGRMSDLFQFGPSAARSSAVRF